MAAAYTEVVPEMTRDIESQPGVSKTMSLVLEVSDPEVVFELRKHTVGDERNEFALTALRIGVLSLRAASGQIDAAGVKEAGDKLIADIRLLLAERASDLTNGIAASLTQYFDPASGLMTQRLESLLKKDGDLEYVLNQHLGSQDSVLAKTLASYLGEQSPVFKLLSPGDAQGIRAQVENTLTEALAEQRRQVLREFSLDSKESALSRLVLEMQALQGQLKSDFSGQAEKIRTEFSLDKPDSALSRLVTKVESAQQAIVDQFSSDNDASVMNRLSKLLVNTSATIDKNLTLDDEQSALSRLKREIQGAIDGLVRKNEDFHSEVRETLARLASRREEAARSTSHGAAFEDQLVGFVSAEAQGFGDIYRATGNTTGIIKNCKVGDCVVELGRESQAAEARIVWEAKEDRSYDLAKALKEADQARKNREAQVGVFVFSRKTAPEELSSFVRYGNDIVVVWDVEDAASDVFLKAAYSLARALTIRQKAATAKSGEAVGKIDRAVRAVEKQVGQLGDIGTWAETITNNGKKIVDRANKIREALIEEIEQLDENIAELKSDNDPEE